MSYITYECTICRRTKGIQKDNQRVLPNQCQITKGCLGKMLPVGEIATAVSTPSLAGLTDWYPRGESKVTAVDVQSPTTVLLSNTSAGGLTLAVKSIDQASLPIQFALQIEQKKIGDVGFQQFSFKLSKAATSISGKDATGKNLRFDQTAIDENRVIVRLNGVEISPILQPSTVIYNFPTGVVDITVYNDVDTVTKHLFFTRNKSLIPSLARGSWSNVDYVTKLETNGTTSTYVLYSADDLGDLTAGAIKFNKMDNAMLLMSATPYQSVDRYLNLYVDVNSLSADFSVLPVSGQFQINQALVSEIYPPFVIPLDAYIVADLFTVSSGAMVTDTPVARIASSKILGPT